MADLTRLRIERTRRRRRSSGYAQRLRAVRVVLAGFRQGAVEQALVLTREDLAIAPQFGKQFIRDRD